MILQTADNRLIIQHRGVSVQRLHEDKMSQGNYSYTDIPGASVAGVVDASISSAGRKPGTPDTIDTESVKDLIFKEAGEELGLAREDIDHVIIAGIAKDPVKPHDEFLMLGETNLTAEEVKATSRKSNRNKNLGDADFDEKFVDIESSPWAVEMMLTQIHCPLPSTHAAALLAAGYSLELQANGQEAAESWKQRVQTGLGENYQLMDEAVAAFYIAYSEMLDDIPERFWGKNAPDRNPNGYDPNYTPEEQGLPSFDNELIRVGLLPETRTFVPQAELYDVDGVLTDPVSKVPDSHLLDDIAAKLHAGMPIGLNTGRATQWINEHVVPELKNRLNNDSLLNNLVVIGEKGGTWTYFDELGNMVDGRSKYLAVPNELVQKVTDVVTKDFADTMFVDKDKTTMLTIEIANGLNNHEAFKAAQARLVARLMDILKETDLHDIYRVDPTTIATDIESPLVGKDLGAERFTQWLQDKGVVAERFITFGDSISDADMALELQRSGRDATFVYVGPTEKLEGRKLPSNVVVYPGYNQGVAQYIAETQQSN